MGNSAHLVTDFVVTLLLQGCQWQYNGGSTFNFISSMFLGLLFLNISTVLSVLVA